jgi:hypothetical protein
MLRGVVLLFAGTGNSVRVQVCLGRERGRVNRIYALEFAPE